MESQEPGATNLLASLWWKWMAPADGAVQLREGHYGWGWLVLYEGDAIEGLSTLAMGVSDPPSWQGLVAPVRAGHAYAIQAGHRRPSSTFEESITGPITLDFKFHTRPPNDDFDQAAPLTGDRVVVRANVVAASMEPWEVMPGDDSARGLNGSLWWRWRATVPGLVTFHLEVPPHDPSDEPYTLSEGIYPSGENATLQVLRGESPGQLSLLAGPAVAVTGSPGYYSSPVVALPGEEYRLRLTATMSPSAELGIRVSPGPAPAVELAAPVWNQAFAAGERVSARVDLSDPGGQARRVIFRLRRTGPAARAWETELTAPPFLASWESLPPGDYTILAQARDELGVVGQSQEVSFQVRPEGDRLAEATGFVGAPSHVTGSVAATYRCAPPAAAAQLCGAWWRWTAAADGPVSITPDCPQGGEIQMRVFDGDDIDNLMLLGAAEAWNSQLIGGGSVTFVAKQGRSYPILIQGSALDYRISVEPHLPPTVVLTQPRDGSRFLLGERIPLEGDVVGSDRPVARVGFFATRVPSQPLAVLTEPPYRVEDVSRWFAGETWTHSIVATATDIDGVVGVSEPVQFELSPAPPPNDNFASATPAGALSEWVEGSLEAATLEPGEPQGGTDGSVWWSWTPPHTGPFTIVAEGVQGFRIYRGDSLTALSLIAEGRASYQPNKADQWPFEATSTAPLRIALDGYNSVSGTPGNRYRLKIVPGRPPRIELGEVRGLQPRVGSRIQLEAVVSDPDGDLARVDYYMTNALLGSVTTAPYTLNYVVAVEPGCHALRATAVDAQGLWASTTTSVSLCVVPAWPPNDAFAARERLGTTPLRVEGSGNGATLEPGEAWTGGSNGDVWYTWTAEKEGHYAVVARPASSGGPGSVAAITVFRGTSLTDLKVVSRVTSSPFALDAGVGVGIAAAAGEIYQIAVEGALRFVLELGEGDAPSVSVEATGGAIQPQWGDSLTLEAHSNLDPAHVREIRFMNGYYPFIGARWLGTTTTPPYRLVVPGWWETFDGNYGVVLVDDQGTPWSSPELILKPQTTATNIDFEDRALLTGNSVHVPVMLGNAAGQTGPPAPLEAWWAWEAQSSGTVHVIGPESRLVVFEVQDPASPVGLPLTWSPAGGRPWLYHTSFGVRRGVNYAFAYLNPEGWDLRDSFSFWLDADDPVSPRMDSAGAFRFELATTLARTWRLETSTNLVDWSPLQTLEGSGGVIPILDAGAGDIPRRFYRAVPQP